MKKKILCLIMSCCLIATLFAGCMQGTSETKINKNGTVNVTVTSWYEKDVFDQASESSDTSESSITANEGMDMREMDVVEHNGVKCYTTTEKNNFASINELKTHLNGEDTMYLNDDVYYVSSDTIYYSIQDDAAAEFLMYDSFGTSYNAKMKTEVTYSFEFEEPIKQTNGVVDPANPNKVSYTFSSINTYDEVFVSTADVSKEKLKADYIAKEKVKAAKLAKVKIKKVYAKKKSSNRVKVQIKKVNGVNKYQVQVSKAKKFTKKNILVSKTMKKAKFTVKSKKLKNKKKLYVRVRTLSDVGKGKWSKVKKVKIK